MMSIHLRRLQQKEEYCCDKIKDQQAGIAAAAIDGRVAEDFLAFSIYEEEPKLRRLLSGPVIEAYIEEAHLEDAELSENTIPAGQGYQRVST